MGDDGYPILLTETQARALGLGLPNPRPLTPEERVKLGKPTVGPVPIGAPCPVGPRVFLPHDGTRPKGAVSPAMRHRLYLMQILHGSDCTICGYPMVLRPWPTS
jgi:hypothetical protein